MPKTAKRHNTKITGQYDEAFYKNNSDVNNKKKEKRKETDDEDNSVVIPQNSTNLCQLYINNNNNIEDTRTVTVYMGRVPYNISTQFNPVDDFYHYFKSTMNNLCGFLDEKNISLETLKNNPASAACHLFLSMLYYNNIVIPRKLKLHKFDSPVVLGEGIFYINKYDNNELNIYISNQIIQNLFYKDTTYDVTFSRVINTAQYCIKQELSSDNSSNLVISAEMYRHLVILFTICDHAATHFIEEYLTGKTDWIHHQNFGRGISNFTTINSIFTISANIKTSSVMPKMYADIQRNCDYGNSVLNKLTNVEGDAPLPGGIMPIQSLLTNIY
ncbi:hypothetical protein PmNV_069 [Penaeus monodon nudivirus]|uniref:Uncharacterized protein n=1 Tax=Penaeus monodon nudivirus TaxID=1529056 RepID=A0A076FCB1_9VIRU|nr:hypothetical protein PmNV_069 [Penaeus monodon nudivirus]AII15857.1 hypothetical protein PmNV_069 [Penaeus monodon nudivirus]